MLTHSSTSVTFFLLFLSLLFFVGSWKFPWRFAWILLKPARRLRDGVCRTRVLSSAAVRNQTSRSAPLCSSLKRSRQTVYRLGCALTTPSKQPHQYLNWSIMIYSVTVKKRGDGFCQTVFSPLITTLLNDVPGPVWKYNVITMNGQKYVCSYVLYTQAWQPYCMLLLGTVHILLVKSEFNLLERRHWNKPKCVLIHFWK